MRGLAVLDDDMALNKNFRLPKEGMRLTLRIEAYNVFNKQEFGTPVSASPSWSGTTPFEDPLPISEICPRSAKSPSRRARLAYCKRWRGSHSNVRKTSYHFVARDSGGRMAWASEPDGAGLEPGHCPHPGSPAVRTAVSVPDWQVHEYNDNFYILRESGCINYEKPFLYLIFGDKKALLEDTGAGQVQTAPFVMGLLEKWAKKTDHAPVQLMVVHSHGHGDHTAGDKQFQAMPESSVCSRPQPPASRRRRESQIGPPIRELSI